MIELGTFIVYLQERNKLYGRIIDYDEGSTTQLKVEQFDSGGKISCIILSASNVSDIAFVSPSEDPTYAGMNNIFENPSVLYRFPCEAPDCCVSESYAATVWKGLERVRRMLRRMLSSSNQNQGIFAKRRAETYLSSATFGYIRRHLIGRNGVSFVTGRRYHRFDMQLQEGLSAVTTRKTYECERIEFAAKEGVDALTGIVGSICVLGLRRLRPKVDDPPVPLIGNDVVHYIVEEEGSVSVAFEYFAAINRFILEASYKPYVVMFDGNGLAITCPSSRVADAIARRQAYNYSNNIKQNNGINQGNYDDNSDDDDDDEQNNSNTHFCIKDCDLVGSEFEMEEQVFQVVSVNKGEVIVTCDEDNAITKMDREEVEGLVDKYLE